MKVKSRDVKAQSVISLEDEEGEFGRIIVKKLQQKELVDLVTKRDEDKGGNLYHKAVCNSIIAIEGLSECGKEITVKQVEERTVFPETMKIIYEAFNAMLSGGEVDPKKETPEG